MHAKILSATTLGIAAHLVEVECDLSLGMLDFFIVGLPDKAINESKERIRAALKNSGLKIPERVIVINLAPASLKKIDILFDVAISVAILQASQLITLTPDFLQETLFLGELMLDGRIRPVRGVLSIAHAALQWGYKRIIVPKGNQFEAALIKGLEVIGVESVVELVAYLRGEATIKPTPSLFDDTLARATWSGVDFNQVKGQFSAKRALQIAATGGHNILFVGPPGSGKTMLAKRLSTILPPLTFDEIIDITKVYSVAGQLGDQALVVERPFRNPHHTISQAGLVGGGSNPKPGEITLAHRGVLFLDEFTEFSRPTLEVLREPLEQGSVHISRAMMAVEYPAQFLLVAALNPCPCGYFGDAIKKCVCLPQQIVKYFGKLSGPLLDRIDLHVPVSAVHYDDIKDKNTVTRGSAEMYAEVLKAKEFQRQRAQGVLNAQLKAQEVEEFCILTEKAEEILKLAFARLGLSMRAYHKVLKVARTIADLEQSSVIDRVHVQEAISYRSLDQKTQNS